MLYRAKVIILHDIHEHGAIYDSLIESLVNGGYAVFALDYQGHGESQGKEGYIESFEYWIKDAITFYDIVQTLIAGDTFVIGQGIGAVLGLFLCT